MIHSLEKLPDGYRPVDDIMQLYKLRKGKKKWNPDNIIRDNLQIVYVFSELCDGYYRKTLSPEIPDDLLKKYIERDLLYFKPKE